MGRPSKVPPVPLGPGDGYCFGCNAAKPLHHFHRDRSRPNGRRTICKRCDDHRRQLVYRLRRTCRAVQHHLAHNRP